ncbi:hypothetical protein ACFX13_028141 [Malus domestica]
MSFISQSSNARSKQQQHQPVSTPDLPQHQPALVHVLATFWCHPWITTSSSHFFPGAYLICHNINQLQSFFFPEHRINSNTKWVRVTQKSLGQMSDMVE